MGGSRAHCIHLDTIPLMFAWARQVFIQRIVPPTPGPLGIFIAPDAEEVPLACSAAESEPEADLVFWSPC